MDEVNKKALEDLQTKGGKSLSNMYLQTNQLVNNYLMRK